MESPLERARQDISDVLMVSLGYMPPDYNPRPRNRHERRRNKALMRDHTSRLLARVALPAIDMRWTIDRLVEGEVD